MVKVIRSVSPFCVVVGATLREALARITENQSGVVFVVDENGQLIGMLTDGDLRNWLIGSNKSNLDDSVLIACNRDCFSLPISSSPGEIQTSINQKIRQIPLVDSSNRLVGIALSQPFRVEIDSVVISEDHPAFIIAEIGNNHNGNVEKAFQLVDEAVNAGADCAKFQIRDLESLYGKEVSLRPALDLGVEYTLDLLRKNQLKIADLFKVFDYCREKNIVPLCTPWDERSLEVLESYGIGGYKIASADLTNYEFVEKVARCQKPVICSTGMSKEFEIKGCVSRLAANNAEFILLLCNSTYPTPFKDIHLNYLDRLQELAEGRPVGYSGHERGFVVPIAAVARGAKVIEKHLTLDKQDEGIDHRVSLDPIEFAAMVQGIREIELSLGDSLSRRITQGELINRQNLGKSVYASRNIGEGEVLRDEDLVIRSPGHGIEPYRKAELIGRAAVREITKGEVFYETDLSRAEIRRRHYRFNHRYGIPVRFHDFEPLIKDTNFDLVEFHLSYQDLDADLSSVFSQADYALEVVVHSPEIFGRDHILDLCSRDQAYRQRSVEEFQRVVSLATEVARVFQGSTKPKIITNVGGFSLESFLSDDRKKEAYAILKETLNEFANPDVEIVPQTMPPFPWHFGGQRFHNLFTDSSSIRDFCESTGSQICLDISHSKLFCNYENVSFKHFLQEVAPFVAHMHLVDAKGDADEGLQIGEGEVDFGLVADIFQELGRSISFVPEIWQGHHNNGYGFWKALERLETYFGDSESVFRKDSEKRSLLG